MSEMDLLFLNEEHNHSSDIVFADMYQANAMDSFQGTIQFLERCWHLLSNDGWLVINFHRLPDFNHPYMLRLSHLYPDVFCYGTGSGNFIMFDGKQLKRPLSNFRSNVGHLSNCSALPPRSLF